MDDWLVRGGPAGAVLGFALGGLLLVPVGVVYGRLTAAAPEAGGEMTYADGLAPRAVRFLVGWMMLLAYAIVCPYEAVAVMQLSAALIPELQAVRLYEVAGSVIYLPTLVIGLAVVGGVTVVNYLGVHRAARLQSWLTAAVLVGVVAFIAAGARAGAAANLSPAFPATGAVAAVLAMLQVVPYFLAGFETVARNAEERGVGFAPRRFLPVTLAALGGAVAFYALVVAVTAGLHPWQALIERKLATAYAFRSAFGSERVGNALLVVALVALVQVLNGCFVAAARQLFALARAGMVPPALAALHPRWLTPARAVVAVGVATAGGCLFGKAVLVPISEVGSLAFAVGWLAACLAYCHPKWRSGRRGPGAGVAGSVVAAGLLAVKLCPGSPGCLSGVESAALGAWVVVGLVLYHRSPG
jgi:amino acid transporter